MLSSWKLALGMVLGRSDRVGEDIDFVIPQELLSGHPTLPPGTNGRIIPVYDIGSRYSVVVYALNSIDYVNESKRMENLVRATSSLDNGISGGIQGSSNLTSDFSQIRETEFLIRSQSATHIKLKFYDTFPEEKYLNLANLGTCEFSCTVYYATQVLLIYFMTERVSLTLFCAVYCPAISLLWSGRRICKISIMFNTMVRSRWEIRGIIFSNSRQ